MEKTKKEINTHKETIIRAMQARSILFLSGFLSESENQKAFQRIRKFQDKHKVEITEKELWVYKLY